MAVKGVVFDVTKGKGKQKAKFRLHVMIYCMKND